MSLLLFPNREQVRLPSVERPHIYREPRNRSVFTRKHEPVEPGDVQHLVRDCNDRISENIMKVPRGQNPYGEWGYPYKVNKAFRPPLMHAFTDLSPLSRQPRPNTSVTALAHFPYPTRVELMKAIDRSQIRASVWTMPQPDLTFVLGDVHERPDVNAYINPTLLANSIAAPTSVDYRMYDPVSVPEPVLEGRVLTPAVTTNPDLSEYDIIDLQRKTHVKMRDINPISVLSPGFQIALYDSTDRSLQRLDLAPRQAQNIAVNTVKNSPITLETRQPGTPIRLKDYNWFILERPDGSQILSIDPTNRGLPELKQAHPSMCASAQPSRTLDFDANRQVELRQKTWAQPLGGDRTMEGIGGNIRSVSNENRRDTRENFLVPTNPVQRETLNAQGMIANGIVNQPRQQITTNRHQRPNLMHQIDHHAAATDRIRTVDSNGISLRTE